MSDTLFVFEIFGVIAFAISGALVAIDREMDIFGVCTLGVVTATGGGVIRDLILGITPPTIFVEPIFAFVAIITSIVFFLKPIRTFLQKNEEIFDLFLIVTDSIGLGLFAMTGIKIAHSVSQDYTVFLLCFVGMITGTGGSILRDMLSQNTPSIFVKHFYACAALIGSLAASLLWNRIDNTLAMAIGAFTVITLRLFAAYFRWELPHA